MRSRKQATSPGTLVPLEYGRARRSTAPADASPATAKAPEPGSLFVGRARELATLRASLEAALAGRGRFFLIAGEPGIGKTSLAEVVALEATVRGARLARGRCWEGDGAPSLWPWVQVLRSFVRDSPAADRLAEDLGRGAAYVAQVVTEIRDRRPDIALVPAPDGEQARFQLFDSVTIYLRNLAAAAPLFILIDDLQWADAVSLRLLRFVAREMNDAPILILATYRDIEVAHGYALADVLASLRLERGVTRLLLRGLSESEVGEMSRAVRGGEVPHPLVRTLHAETGGNPFFVEEILRHLTEEGTLEVPLRSEAEAGIGPHERLGKCIEATRRLLAQSEKGDRR